MLDTDGFVPTHGDELIFQVLQWNSLFGSSGDFDVQFTQATDFLSYNFQANGLYLTAIPEPRMFAGVVGLLVLAARLLRRRQRGA